MKSLACALTLLISLSALSGCSLFSPEKRICKKMEKLYGEEEMKTPKGDCATQLKKLKSESPEAYACIKECVPKSDTREELGKCQLGCSFASSGSSSSSSGGSSGGSSPVDDVTASSVKTRLRGAYDDVDVIKTEDVGDSEVLTVRVKDGSQAFVLRVALMKISSHADGVSKVASATSGAKADSAVGNKQAVVVACVGKITVGSSDVESCGYTDPIITNALKAITSS